jgi:cytochrome P450
MLLSAVLTAGNETTRNTLDGAVILLAEHPAADEADRPAATPGKDRHRGISALLEPRFVDSDAPS